MTARPARRALLTGGLAASLAGLTGCAARGRVVRPEDDVVARVEGRRRTTRSSQTVRSALTARTSSVDLGGVAVDTWAFDAQVPGPELRVTAGQTLRVAVSNSLPAPTTVHWHGLALRNDMDGVPGVTQEPIDAGGAFTYEFIAPDPGTYFYHPHVGVQLDRGLYGALIVDDPHEPGLYDLEWVVVLDDWIDGTGTTPEEVLQGLLAGGTPHEDMPGMSMDGGAGSKRDSPGTPLLGSGGDVEHPHYLINGRISSAPVTLSGRPGQRVRVRLINAAADTAFRLAIGGHRITVTHSDGFPVAPVTGDALLIGMGERYDFTVTLGDGAFPLVARAEGKDGEARAVVRTASGRRPATSSTPAELKGRILTVDDLNPVDSARLVPRAVTRRLPFQLRGSMSPYRWTINGQSFPDGDALDVRDGERVRLEVVNTSTMFHPVHLHGHTFAVADNGVRKDTVLVRPRQRMLLDFDADNPGQWVAHCHNIYHAEAGMMATVAYVTR